MLLIDCIYAAYTLFPALLSQMAHKLLSTETVEVLFALQGLIHGASHVSGKHPRSVGGLLSHRRTYGGAMRSLPDIDNKKVCIRRLQKYEAHIPKK